jgi:hypothetical protein
MAKCSQLVRTESAIEPDLKDFIDVCLVPILVRNALKEIKAAESGGDLESTALPHIRCANGGSE